MSVFVFCSIVLFHGLLKLALQASNEHTKANVHLIVSGQGILVNIRGLLRLVNPPPYYEQFFTLVFGVAKKALKLCLHEGKRITPPLVEL